MNSMSLGRKCPVICLLLLSACVFLCFSSISSFKEQSNRFQELDELCDVFGLNIIFRIIFGITNYSILQQKIILEVNFWCHFLSLRPLTYPSNSITKITVLVKKFRFFGKDCLVCETQLVLTRVLLDGTSCNVSEKCLFYL